MYFSFVIPVYNRPEEVQELLQSLSLIEQKDDFEVIIIEDGSVEKCESVCSRFRESVNINYFFKENSGPGDSRNYGMKRANGDYFIILDSDCIVPPEYLRVVKQYLKKEFVDCYGGPDAAMEGFSDVQKAINYSMTSPFSTGGIRGGGEKLGKFQPRSFNMGISKAAFEASGGFGKIHPGEDPDLTIRLWNLGFKTKLFKEAYVYHKRRISFDLFYKQVQKFGMVRVILNKWHPSTRKLTFWFPALFILGLSASIIAAIWMTQFFLMMYICYFLIIFVDSSFKNSLKVGLYSVYAILVQFFGYGKGFLISFTTLRILNKNERIAFPHLFFR
ncbi:MAG: glycosyltransferase [Nonlabens sp.]